jgi:hypothetical protein
MVMSQFENVKSQSIEMPTKVNIFSEQMQRRFLTEISLRENGGGVETDTLPMVGFVFPQKKKVKRRIRFTLN